MKFRNTILLILVVSMMIPVLASAQDDDDDYRYKTWRMRRSHAGFSGHGGFYFNVQQFDSQALDNLALSMGIPKLGDEIYGFGGYGLAHLGGGWRIGGGGYGGEVTTDGVFTDSTGQKYNKEMQMAVGGGGFIVEYSPWMIGPVNFGLGVMIGGGGVVIELHQNTGVHTWDDITGQFSGEIKKGENIIAVLQRGYFAANPYVTARLHILDWMALEGTMGYNYNTLNKNFWMLGDKDINGGGREIELKKPQLRIGLVFGG